MEVVCLDLEGVLVPEIWIAFAEKTGIPELRLTTREVSDYDVLMKGRIDILQEHGLTLADIQDVIATIRPLEGAKDFLDELRSLTQVIILSDTFREFASPLMRQLGWPTIFCNSLIVDSDGMITGYSLRQNDGKRKAIEHLRKEIGGRGRPPAISVSLESARISREDMTARLTIRNVDSKDVILNSVYASASVWSDDVLLTTPVIRAGDSAQVPIVIGSEAAESPVIHVKINYTRDLVPVSQKFSFKIFVE